MSKRPTDVSVVLHTLIGRDDFMNRRMLAEATELPRDRLMMAISHLLHYKAIDAVAAGPELWFMATPNNDTRVRVLAEITEGITRKRKPRSKPAAPAPSPLIQ